MEEDMVATSGPFAGGWYGLNILETRALSSKETGSSGYTSTVVESSQKSWLSESTTYVSAQAGSKVNHCNYRYIKLDTKNLEIKLSQPANDIVNNHIEMTIDFGEKVPSTVYVAVTNGPLNEYGVPLNPVLFNEVFGVATQTSPSKNIVPMWCAYVDIVSTYANTTQTLKFKTNTTYRDRLQGAIDDNYTNNRDLWLIMRSTGGAIDKPLHEIAVTSVRINTESVQDRPPSASTIEMSEVVANSGASMIEISEVVAVSDKRTITTTEYVQLPSNEFTIDMLEYIKKNPITGLANIITTEKIVVRGSGKSSIETIERVSNSVGENRYVNLIETKEVVIKPIEVTANVPLTQCRGVTAVDRLKIELPAQGYDRAMIEPLSCQKEYPYGTVASQMVTSVPIPNVRALPDLDDSNGDGVFIGYAMPVQDHRLYVAVDDFKHVSFFSKVSGIPRKSVSVGKGKIKIKVNELKLTSWDIRDDFELNVVLCDGSLGYSTNSLPPYPALWNQSWGVKDTQSLFPGKGLLYGRVSAYDIEQSLRYGGNYDWSKFLEVEITWFMYDGDRGTVEEKLNQWVAYSSPAILFTEDCYFENCSNNAPNYSNRQPRAKIEVSDVQLKRTIVPSYSTSTRPMSEYVVKYNRTIKMTEEVLEDKDSSSIPMEEEIKVSGSIQRRWVATVPKYASWIDPTFESNTNYRPKTLESNNGIAPGGMPTTYAEIFVVPDYEKIKSLKNPNTKTAIFEFKPIQANSDFSKTLAIQVDPVYDGVLFDMGLTLDSMTFNNRPIASRSDLMAMYNVLEREWYDSGTNTTRYCSIQLDMLFEDMYKKFVVADEALGVGEYNRYSQAPFRVQSSNISGSAPSLIINGIWNKNNDNAYVYNNGVPYIYIEADVYTISSISQLEMTEKIVDGKLTGKNSIYITEYISETPTSIINMVEEVIRKPQQSGSATISNIELVIQITVAAATIRMTENVTTRTMASGTIPMSERTVDESHSVLQMNEVVVKESMQSGRSELQQTEYIKKRSKSLLMCIEFVAPITTTIPMHENVIGGGVKRLPMSEDVTKHYYMGSNAIEQRENVIGINISKLQMYEYVSDVSVDKTTKRLRRMRSQIEKVINTYGSKTTIALVDIHGEQGDKYAIVDEIKDVMAFITSPRLMYTENAIAPYEQNILLSAYECYISPEYYNKLVEWGWANIVYDGPTNPIGVFVNYRGLWHRVKIPELNSIGNEDMYMKLVMSYDRTGNVHYPK